MSLDSMRSSSDTESEEEQEESNGSGLLRSTCAALTQERRPRRSSQPYRSNMRGWRLMEPHYTRLSAKPEVAPSGKERSVELLFRDNRAETFLMLARLLYLHKLIYEEEAEEQKKRMREKLKDLQDRAKMDYKCNKISWINDLSKPLGDVADDRLNDEIRERLFSVWQQFDIAVVDLMIYMCADHAQVFLHGLCLKVRDHRLRESTRMWQLETKWQAGCLMPAVVEGWQVPGKWDTSKKLNQDDSGLDEIAPPDLRLSDRQEDEDEDEDEEATTWCDWLCTGYGSRKIESELYFTLCSELISGMYRGDTELDHLHFLQSMLRCHTAALFATPLGYASIQRCWRHGAWLFVSLRAFDVVYLLALCIFIVPISHRSHGEDATWPDELEVLFLAMLSARSGLFLLMEFIMALYVAWQFRRRFPEGRDTLSIGFLYFRATFLNPFTALCSGVEMWSFLFTCFLLHDCWVRDAAWGEGEEEEELDISTFIQGTILYKRPVMLCCLLLAKWAQLMLQLLALEGLLSPLLPAWRALNSENSRIVLASFILLCVGTANGYYALPVTGGHKEGFLGALFIMFRLDLMGDFDEEELMAGTQNEASLPNGRLGAHVVPEMYFALKGFTILCALVFTVSLLNVYVGILSAKYDEARSNLLDEKGRFRAVPAFRIHLFMQLVRCIRHLGHGKEEHDNDMGFWILLPKKHLPDHLDAGNAHPSLNWEGWAQT